MRFLLAMMLAAMPTMAAAATCQSGSNTVLKLVNWQAKMVKGSYRPFPKITVTYEYLGEKPIRMMNASVWFTDALGNSLSGFNLDKDVHLKHGDKHTESGNFPGAESFERLTKIEHADVSGIICVDAVLHDDGTKETFK